MTGYGEARFQSDGLAVSIELRSLNNRHLKVSVRAPEPYNLLESEFEKVVRKTIRRGTVQIHMKCERRHTVQDYRINTTALESYVGQLEAFAAARGTTAVTDTLRAMVGAHAIGGILALPGVVPEPSSTLLNADEEWEVLEKVLEDAVAKLQIMRREEGRAMATEFLAQREQIGLQLESIRERAPNVVDAYRERMRDRLTKLLAEQGIGVDRNDIIKEVAIFAERCDITEEIVRLASHLDQFRDMLEEAESPGRKLEFLMQEMFRETNTIGSKATDVQISRHVVEIKAILEKTRELVQNVE